MNTSSISSGRVIRSGMIGTMTRAVIAKRSGSTRRAAFVDPPDLLLTQQVTQDQTGGFVIPLDAPEREAGLAHRREHDRFLGAGREPRSPSVAVERV